MLYHTNKEMTQRRQNIGVWAFIALSLESVISFVFGTDLWPSVFPYYSASRELSYLKYSSIPRSVSVVFKDAKYTDGVLHLLLQRNESPDERWAVITDNDGNPLPSLSIDMLQVWNGDLHVFKQGKDNGAKVLSDVHKAMLEGQTLVDAVTRMFSPTMV
jgi:hypothetical protein